MTSRKIYTIYKDIVRELGLFQLDVYRIIREGKQVDIVRLYDPGKNQVFIVDLDNPREALAPIEFLDKLVKAAEQSEIPLPERKVKQLREALSKQAVQTT